jgi:hypothetical protein
MSKVHICTCPGNVGLCGTPLSRPEQYADPGRGTLGPGAVFVMPGTLCERCRKSYTKEGGRVYEGASDVNLILALRTELERARGVIGRMQYDLLRARETIRDLEHERAESEFMP